MTNKTQSNDEMVQAAREFVEEELQIAGDGRKARRLVMEFEGNQIDGTGWGFAVIADKFAAFAATQTEPLRKELQYALDDLSMFDNACPYCADSDIGPPLRCSEHSEPEWHHFLDPGDGLPSPCKNGHLFEAVFQEAAEPLKEIGRAHV